MRATLPELLEHPVFDEDFRASFEAKVEAMKEQDEAKKQELMKVELRTKDGRLELSAEELVTEEEEEVKSEEEEEEDDDDDDDDQFRDDDSSSAVASADSSNITPASSSGIPPVNKLNQ